MLLVKYLNKILYSKYQQENYEEEVERNDQQQNSSKKRKQSESGTGASSSSSSSASSSVTGHGAAAAIGTTTLFDRNGFVRVIGTDYSTSINFFDHRKFSQAIEMNSQKSSMCQSCVQSKVTKRNTNNYCKCCGKSIQSEIDGKRSKKKMLVTAERQQMEQHSEEELLAEAKIAYFKRRKRMTYSSNTNSKKFKLDGFKNYVDYNQAPPCCLVNGKAFKNGSNIKPKTKKLKTSSSIYISSLVSSSAHSSKQFKSDLSRIKLKKSKAILNMNKLKYNPLEFVKQLPSSTLTSIPNDLNQSNGTSSVKLVCKLKKTKPIINKRIVNVQKCTHTPLALPATQMKSERTPRLQRTCSTFVVDFASTPIKLAPKTSTPIKIVK